MESINYTMDEFLEKFFENLADREGINAIKKSVKDNIDSYNKTSVWFNALSGNNDRDIESVDISSEGYKDGEDVNIDVFIKGDYNDEEDNRNVVGAKS